MVRNPHAGSLFTPCRFTIHHSVLAPCRIPVQTKFSFSPVQVGNKTKKCSSKSKIYLNIPLTPPPPPPVFWSMWWICTEWMGIPIQTIQFCSRSPFNLPCSKPFSFLVSGTIQDPHSTSPFKTIQFSGQWHHSRSPFNLPIQDPCSRFLFYLIFICKCERFQPARG